MHAKIIIIISLQIEGEVGTVFSVCLSVGLLLGSIRNVLRKQHTNTQQQNPKPGPGEETPDVTVGREAGRAPREAQAGGEQSQVWVAGPGGEPGIGEKIEER